MGRSPQITAERVMRRRPHVLMLFLDGVGIGRKETGSNPFFVAPLEALRRILGGSVPHLEDAYRESSGVTLAPLDATLGVPGLPQSGTGQVALLTGRNAALTIGRHFGPFPYSTLKPLLQEENIFTRLKASGRSGYYANAFPQLYFDHMKKRSSRMSAIPLSWTMAGHALHDAGVLDAGAALSADVTNERWPKLGYPKMPAITPEEAGRRLYRLAQAHDFVLYELYLTDHAGHSQSMDEAVRALTMVDRLLGGVMESFDRDSTLLLVTSDHGNLEDLSTKSHTRNPVPLLAVGMASRDFLSGVTDLTGVAPAILRCLAVR
jgi:2,3-bisphosphoglycerate-independent phosphoglycerate mutase